MLHNSKHVKQIVNNALDEGFYFNILLYFLLDSGFSIILVFGIILVFCYHYALAVHSSVNSDATAAVSFLTATK